MKKENITNISAVLTLLTGANLQKPSLFYVMTLFRCIISNFEKNYSIFNNYFRSPEDYYSQRFHSYKFFQEKVTCVKNGT